MVRMSEEILIVVNAVIYYGKYIVHNNYILPEKNFDYIQEMEKYYKSLPLPKGMNKNRIDFERILRIGWYSNKELERLNSLSNIELSHERWK